ncbi:phage tail length tape measure family protein [Methylocella sp.]|uniref:phage tail length tape measure family protein n=1 Tax=Methylocella sp. TaxID=1978226 RepID=UPI003784F664
MATDLERLVVEISANVDGLTKSLAKATGDVNTFGKSADAETRRVAKAISQNLGGVRLTGIGGLDKISAGMTVFGRDSARAFALRAAGAEKMRIGFAAAAAAAAKAGAVSKATFRRDQWQNLGYQLNDILSGLASGQRPMQVLAQQGGQVYQVMQQAEGGIGGATKAILGLVTPSRLMGAAAAGGAALAIAAFAKWQSQTESLSNSLNGLGRKTGLGPSGLLAAARSGVAGANTAFGPITQGQGEQLAGTFARSGVSGANIPAAVGVSGVLAGVLGKSLPEAGDALASALRDPAKAGVELLSSIGGLNAATLTAIQRASANGDAQGAQRAVVLALSKGLADATQDINSVASATRNLSAGLSNALSRLGEGIARAVAPTDAQRIEDIKAQLAQPKPLVDLFGKDAEYRTQLGRELATLQKSQADREAAAAKKKADQKANDASLQAKALAEFNQAQADGLKVLLARTPAERAAAEGAAAYNAAIRENQSDDQAAAARLAAFNRVIAETGKAAQDSVRDARFAAELAGLRPEQRREREIEQRFQLDRERFGTAPVPPIGAPSGAGVSVKPFSGGAGAAVDIAATQLGKNERIDRGSLESFLAASGTKIDPLITKWCGAFVASSLQRAGVPAVPGGLTATNWLRWGVPATGGVQRGDVLVENRGLSAGQGGGHVGFATGVIDPRTGKIEMLSGNSSNAVSLDLVDPRSVVARRYGGAQTPSGLIAASSGQDAASQNRTQALLGLERDRGLDLANQRLDVSQYIASEAQKAAALHQTAGAAAEAAKYLELKQQAEQRGLTVTPELTVAYQGIAAAYGQQAQASADLTKQQEAARYVADSLADGIAALATRSASAKDVLRGLAQQFASMAIKGLLTGSGPFGFNQPAGGGLGGLFGMLFGGGFKFADGGPVPGVGGPRSDNILARLSPGEYVVNAAATARHGALLQAINYGHLPRFADGGIVGSAIPIPSAVSRPSGRSAVLTNSPTINMTPAEGVTPQQLAQVLEQNNKQFARNILPIVRDADRRFG